MSDKNQPALSIIVPTLNEAGNIPHLLPRIHAPLHKAGIDYEVIIIDDHSTDGTVAVAEKLSSTFPVQVQLKKGRRGKAYSLLEGFAEANNPILVMLDADLQCPPEAIVPMYRLMQKNHSDVVISVREERETSLLRRISSDVFNLLFVRLLFGIKFDTQSGLKMFRKNVIDAMELFPSPWSFDLEFIIRTFENQFKLLTYAIPFSARTSGSTKIGVVSGALELAQASLRLRLRTSVRRTWAGMRQNVKFLKNTALSILVASFLLSQIIVSGHASADATTLPVDTTPVTTTVDPTIDTVTATTTTTPTTDDTTDGLGIQPTTSPTDTTTSIPVVTTVTMPTPATTVSSNTVSTPTTTDMTTPTPTTQGAITIPTSTTTGDTTVAATDSQASLAYRTKLSAATDNEMAAMLYTLQQPTSKHVIHVLGMLLTIVLIASLLCIIFPITLGIYKHKLYTYLKLTRS